MIWHASQTENTHLSFLKEPACPLTVASLAFNFIALRFVVVFLLALRLQCEKSLNCLLFDILKLENGRIALNLIAVLTRSAALAGSTSLNGITALTGAPNGSNTPTGSTAPDRSS